MCEALRKVTKRTPMKHRTGFTLQAICQVRIKTVVSFTFLLLWGPPALHLHFTFTITLSLASIFDSVPSYSSVISASFLSRLFSVTWHLVAKIWRFHFVYLVQQKLRCVDRGRQPLLFQTTDPNRADYPSMETSCLSELGRGEPGANRASYSFPLGSLGVQYGVFEGWMHLVRGHCHPTVCEVLNILDEYILQEIQIFHD